MNNSTRVLLVLLRLAIGWHLLFSGLQKFDPGYPGSEGYLRQATGPLGPMFHGLAGDSLIARYAVKPRPEDQDPAQDNAAERMPPALDAEWDAYFDSFVGFYGLGGEQKEEAKGRLKQAKAQTVRWMEKPEYVVIPSPSGSDFKKEFTQLEIAESYQNNLKKLRELQEQQYTLGSHLLQGSDTLPNKELAETRTEVQSLRARLSRGLAEQTKEMKESLREVLTEEQAKQGEAPEPIRPGILRMSRLDWVNFLVRWGLVLAGAGLLLGFFTRTSCVVGALLILAFYLPVPPLYGLPEMVRAEGYPFINKNIVEMLALLALATTPSGRWAGLDALLHVFTSRRQQNTSESGREQTLDQERN